MLWHNKTQYHADISGFIGTLLSPDMMYQVINKKVSTWKLDEMLSHHITSQQIVKSNRINTTVPIIMKVLLEMIVHESTKQMMTVVQGNNNPTPPYPRKNWPGRQMKSPRR